MLPALLLSLFLCPIGGSREEPDRLTLANGDSIECRVLLEDQAQVVYRAARKIHTLPRSEVREVRSLEHALDDFLQRFEGLDPADVEALAELAAHAGASGLEGEARNAWFRVLTLAPADERAWTALGGVRERGTWKLPVGGRLLDLAEVRARARDWKSPLDLSTVHFHVLTDGAPERALDATLDLERVWRTYDALVARPLGLYMFDEVPEVRAYSDPDDYPRPPVAGADAWFSPAENVLHVNLRPERDPATVMAELTDCLVFNSFRRTLGKTRSIERWLRAGIAGVFAAAVRPDPGHVGFDFASPDLALFRAHAGDPRPLPLATLLGAGNAAFDAGSERQRHATQAYTLVHFLLFADEGAHRAQLADFLRSSAAGKGGPSNLYRALGMDERELAERWSAHVHAVAGA